MKIYKKFLCDAKQLKQKTINSPLVVASPHYGRGNPEYKINLKLWWQKNRKNIIAWIATSAIANALTASQRRAARFIFGIIFLFACGLRADLSTEIKYGQAMRQAQQGNWEQAHNQLNQLVTDNPDRSDILYDSGVAAYRLKKFDSAQAYFKRVTEFDDGAADLKERAHFNLGNTYVATKLLQQAIDEYEKVLDINPENEAAQDNLRIVKEMLEQEKQKQKQEEEKQKKKDQQKNDQQKKNEQKKDQEKQDQKKDQKKNDQDQNGDSDQKDNDSQDQNDSDGQKDQQQNKPGKQDQSEKKKSEKGQEQGEQSPKTDDNADGDQEKKDGDKNNQAEQSGQDNKEEQEGKGDKRPQSGLDDKQSQEKGDDKELGEHEKEPSKDMSEKKLDDSHGTQDQQKKQGAQQGHTSAGRAGAGEQEEKKMDPHEQWIEGIMKQQEKSDAQANKALIRQAINKGGSRQHGQKNW